MLDFHNRVEKIEAHIGNKTIKWKDVCVRIPKYDDEDSEHCYETGLLEIWGYGSQDYENLSDSSILKDLVSSNTSKVYGNPVDFSFYLGGVSKDKEGNIIRAKTAVHSWLTMINADSIKSGDYELDIATGEKVDKIGMEWEKALVRLANDWDGKLIINMRAGHTLGYVLHNSIASDALWVGIGWTVLLIYILFTLGKPFTYEQRIIPVCVGLLAIGMSVLSSYGACSLIGIPYGTLTNVLPILLVALGVDDMYVIMTCWDEAEHIDSVEFRAQIAMRKAGMAITVTSLTDILAFLVGTATSLPGLKWFCIYSAVGIAMVYLLQVTLFVAAMVVNEKWNISRRKKGKPLLMKHQLSKCKTNFGMQNCMNLWGVCLSYHVTKIFILILTFLMFLFSIFNIAHLGKEFDTIWLVPESSSLYKWYNTVEKTFPQYNEKGVVLFKGVKFPEDMNELRKLSRELNSLPEILEVEAWFNEINLQELFQKYEWLKRISPLKQCKLLLQYISFANRRHFRVDFENDEEDNETNDTMRIHPCSTFQIEFQYIPPKTFESKMASMEKIRKLVRNSYVSGYKAVWAHVFGQWETDKIILDDLLKNLCIVLTSVAAITLVLLASIRASFFVILCVIGTLFNVASAAHLWGLTINTVTGIALVLAIGICVDYAVHIAHDFLGASGTKIERTKAALNQMGSAVFHGGASTCLAFILLAPSDNYIYVSYFKILTSVSFFGLYHALVFLPVLLSLCGPDPHPDIKESIFTSSKANRKDNSSNSNGSTNSTYAINFSLPYNPPPYALANSVVGPPLYRKSSSLPSLSCLFSDNLLGTLQTESQTKSTRRSFRHSTCCTKL